MGKHYVPQRHLQRFQIEESPGLVWMYDKQSRRFVDASIKTVAQEADYYDPDIEAALNHTVEVPGNKCIEKLLQCETLTDTERSELALYMLIMATRGPRQRKQIQQKTPEVLSNVVARIREFIENYAATTPQDSVIAMERLRELEAVERKYALEPPEEIVKQTRTPFWSERTAECIVRMAWIIVSAPVGTHFITGDTPAHYFESMGIGRQDSEFTFPISSTAALIGTHRRRQGVYFTKPQARLVREVNRRMISHAERFLFSSKRDDWIDALAQKNELHLSRVRWK